MRNTELNITIQQCLNFYSLWFRVDTVNSQVNQTDFLFVFVSLNLSRDIHLVFCCIGIFIVASKAIRLRICVICAFSSRILCEYKHCPICINYLHYHTLLQKIKGNTKTKQCNSTLFTDESKFTLPHDRHDKVYSRDAKENVMRPANRHVIGHS